jgi:hypothetical protein
MTRNNIKLLLQIKDNKEDLYNLSGVYQLQCADCPLRYVGQLDALSRADLKKIYVI